MPLAAFGVLSNRRGGCATRFPVRGIGFARRLSIQTGQSQPCATVRWSGNAVRTLRTAFTQGRSIA